MEGFTGTDVKRALTLYDVITSVSTHIYLFSLTFSVRLDEVASVWRL